MTVTEHMLLTWGLYRESEQALTYHSVSRLTYLIPPRAFYLTTVESSSIVVLLVPPSRASISSHREHVIPLSTFTPIEHVIRTSSSGHFILPGISSYQAFHPTQRISSHLCNSSHCGTSQSTPHPCDFLLLIDSLRIRDNQKPSARGQLSRLTQTRQTSRSTDFFSVD